MAMITLRTTATTRLAMAARAGVPVRDSRDSQDGPRPSRENANSIRLAAVQEPSSEANALAAAANSSSRAAHSPTNDWARLPSGVELPANFAAPAALAPNPFDSATITITNSGSVSRIEPSSASGMLRRALEVSSPRVAMPSNPAQDRQANTTAAPSVLNGVFAGSWNTVQLTD